MHCGVLNVQTAKVGIYLTSDGWVDGWTVGWGVGGREGLTEGGRYGRRDGQMDGRMAIWVILGVGTCPKIQLSQNYIYGQFLVLNFWHFWVP